MIQLAWQYWTNFFENPIKWCKDGALREWFIRNLTYLFGQHDLQNIIKRMLPHLIYVGDV